jgi:Sulfotransferase domain
VFRFPAELVPKIPKPAAAVLRNSVWAYGTATRGVRRLPDFLIVGAQKAATTALYAYLRWHPSILGPSWKEVSFFDRHYARGADWYRGQFPNLLRIRHAARRHLGPVLVGEASPSYLFHPAAPERVVQVLPNAKLIALLRNPIDRAYSHYQHEFGLGRESLSFEQALEQEEARLAGELERMAGDAAYFSRPWWTYTYFSRGLYAEQLERWLAWFPQEQLLVLRSEELAECPAETYARVLTFLGAAPHDLREYPRIFSRTYSPIDPATRARLAEQYAEPNRRLAELLGRDLGWD